MGAAVALWDVTSWVAVSTRYLEIARASGALAPLSAALNAQRVLAVFLGDFDTATALGGEEVAVKDVTGIGGFERRHAARGLRRATD